MSTNTGADDAAPEDEDIGGQAGDDRRQLRLEEFLPYRLVMLAEQVSQSLSRLYSDRYGLTNPEWRTLAALGQFGQMTSTEIGRHSQMHKTKVSRAVAELEKKNLIVRRTSDADMRVAYLTLTDAGKETYRKLVPLALTFGDRLVGGLSAEELAGFESALASLMRHSDEIASEISESAGNGAGNGSSTGNKTP